MAVDHATEIKNAMISGLWANPNLDDGKNTRQDSLKQIDDSFNETIARIYQDPQVEIDFKSDPFFAAMKTPDDPGTAPNRTTTTEEYEVDQAE